MAFFNSGIAPATTESVIDYTGEQFCREQEKEVGVSNVNDDGPSIAIFTSSIIAMVWWIVQMFVYINNGATLTYGAGSPAVPIAWLFENLGSQSRGLTAWTYLLSFLMLLTIHVIEFIAYLLYMSGDPFLFGVWSSTVGWYGSIFGLAVPLLLIILQLALPTSQGGLSPYDGNTEFSSNAIFNLIGLLLVWLMSSVVHLMLVPRLNCNVVALIRKQKNEKRPCPVQRTFIMTDLQYEAACAAVAKV
jgi:hypothetical protein